MVCNVPKRSAEDATGIWGTYLTMAHRQPAKDIV